MSDIAISVENLSKRYLIGHQATQRERYKALRDVIGQEARNFMRKAGDLFHGRQIVQGDEVEEFWALRDVSFEVKRGEIIGIIGRNGAGKSTLLKILSRITQPTKGRVVLRGRVASLLEVGTGFHPELSGRENILLNGAILGMTQREIGKKFDEIVAFAQIERFLDTPVKHYSSGMYVRLAFAVAAHLEPEILVVDEVLAVGDAEFQKKCLRKMNEASQSEGRTVLFVSHNMGVISSLCPTVIWLDAGSIRQRAAVSDVIAAYLLHGTRNFDRSLNFEHLPRKGTYGQLLRLESLEWLCDLPLRHREPVRARITFRTRARLTGVAIGLGFSSIDGRRLLTYETDLQEGSEDGYRPDFAEPGRYSVDVEIDALPLAPDIYCVDLGCRSGDFHPLDDIPQIAQLEIQVGPKTPAHLVRKDAAVGLVSKWTWRQSQC